MHVAESHFRNKIGIVEIIFAIISPIRLHQNFTISLPVRIETMSLLSDSKVLSQATPIKFVGGKYKKKQGWLDPTRTGDSRMTPIIINAPRKGGLYQTFVENGNWRKISSDHAMTYAEMVFLVPDIEASVVETCRKIVKFDITTDEGGVHAFKEQFGKELENAQEWQEEKGDRAVWRRIPGCHSA